MKQTSSLLSRRHLLLAGTASLVIAACSGGSRKALDETGADGAADDPYADSEWRSLSEAEWKDRLSPKAFAVLRQEDTERAFTSPLEHEKRDGAYHCAGCDLPLFSSETKFDSGTGWPSFWKPLPGAMGTKEDHKLFYTRTEYHCARCLGHQGHVFKDGPPPTGERWCNNGVALTFRPA
ncbi:MAG TPA: peptide-methionine (R)-S-oxide reductase [Hyphomonas adhaerens]|uniref:peptide-methionine (R)-S-oxide reductase n=1 Tax=Hyphomonas adhaerens TaxID=81029 RepID=A0A3B9H0X9_9PROT|nr:peptide-methionine (R)-S-oxide reductase [Hyphomonas adhaerens]